MKYRLEYYVVNAGEQIVQLGEIETKAARSRARALSRKDGDLGVGVGQSVYLIGSDENDHDQEHYTYFAGSLTEKDLVKDWS